MYVLILHISI